MGTTAKIECRTCGAMCTPHQLRRHHGPTKPVCLAHKAWVRMEAEDLRPAGSFYALLDMAGASFIRLPTYAWWQEPVYGEPDWETGEVEVIDYATVEVVDLVPVVPKWARDLAKRLTVDKRLARQLGFTQKRRLVTVKARPKTPKRPAVEETTRVWKTCDLDKPMPIELRARILRVALNNEVARELIADDPEAAGRIIKDMV